MAASIKYDNSEILSTTYIPRFVKHESAPDRIITSVPLAREDGEILIAERYGIKRIYLSGIITGATQAELEDNIDDFKELFSRPEKNLDIDWNGGTLRYVASCSKHDFDRDHFHLLFCPWTAEFTVLSGEGKNTSTTKPLDEHPVTVTTPGADSFSMLGSKPAKPVITLKGSNWASSIKGVEYKNVDTGEKIVVTRNKSWGTTDSIIINCLLKKVTDNLAASAYTEGNFYGVFPKFQIGTNNILITAGGIVNQMSADTIAGVAGGVVMDDDANKRAYQSFIVPYRDETFKGIVLCLEKTGSPGGNMTVRIETDNGNEPSGVLADANATFTITPGSVGVRAYVTKYSANLWTLEANTKYWIVISAAGTSAGNSYDVGYSEIAAYPNGKGASSSDGGVTIVDIPNGDLLFKILYGGEPAAASAKHTVEYTKTYL